MSAVDLATHAELETPRRGPRQWRVWFGLDASLVIPAAEVEAVAALRVPDSLLDSPHAQRCQAARELATWRVAGGAPLRVARRPEGLHPSTTPIATLYGLNLAESGKRGRLKRGARA